MSSVIEDIIHELIDVASGKQAHLSAPRAAELHEALTPGFTDEPLSDEEEAKLADLQARRDRVAADRAAREAAGV